MKSKALVLSVVTLLTMLALAGCTGDSTSTTENTSTETSTETTSTETTSTETTPTETSTETLPAETSSTEMKEIATLEGAKDVQTADVTGNKVTTFKTDMAVDAACEAQAKFVTDAGWGRSEVAPEPAKATTPVASWTQVFTGVEKTLTLLCTQDPTDSKMTIVTMTETASAPAAAM